MDTILMIAGALEAVIKDTEEFGRQLKDLHLEGIPAGSVYFYRQLLDHLPESGGGDETP
ncbi:MAG: hypothetical protein JW904_11820 [Spirochaetales bacterium]|nr:hypothetical protein [Spirochaetales bacterium]